MNIFIGMLIAASLVFAYQLGWRAAHITVLNESERLGAFYVGKKTVVVKEVLETKSEID